MYSGMNIDVKHRIGVGNGQLAGVPTLFGLGQIIAVLKVPKNLQEPLMHGFQGGALPTVKQPSSNRLAAARVARSNHSQSTALLKHMRP